MANRSYLYATNIVPGPDAKANGRKLIGIAEWNYDIPVVFKLLLSGHPRTCPSSIWTCPDEIALLGDYDAGVNNLAAFLAKVEHPAAQALIGEAITFLNQPENRYPYFVLEGGEIFDMADTPLIDENLRLLEQIRNLQPALDQALQSLQPPPLAPPKPVGLMSKLLGRTAEPPQAATDPMPAIRALGLGNWSNFLYFDFSDK